MLLYILISIACTQSVTKDFKLTCKPTVERTYLTKAECEQAVTAQKTCMAVRVVGSN